MRASFLKSSNQWGLEAAAQESGLLFLRLGLIRTPPSCCPQGSGLARVWPRTVRLRQISRDVRSPTANTIYIDEYIYSTYVN
jgi:hypothetical protein